MAYDTFEAYVGVDDEVGNGSGDGSAQWLVYVDNTLVYTSPRRTGADNPYFISVDITGCDELKLVTNTGGNPGDNDYKDHVDWADAKLLSTGGGMLALRGTEDGKEEQQSYGLLGSGGGTEAREHNAQNQITEIDEQPLTYDNNGNLTTDEDGNVLIYDAWNRLVKVEDSNEATIGEYEYDALMRRVEEDGQKLFHSANWQVVEERNATGDTTSQYTWSPIYIDAMVAKDRHTNPGSGHANGMRAGKQLGRTWMSKIAADLLAARISLVCIRPTWLSSPSPVCWTL